jgi:hypothetical protein
MLYTAQRLSLACIEVLVHLDKSQLPRDYVWSKTGLAPEPPLLAFKSLSGIVSCQAVGHAWVSAVSQLAVRVPSVIIPEEFNILLNPRHAEYNNLVWSDPRPFRFDPRLFIAEPRILLDVPVPEGLSAGIAVGRARACRANLLVSGWPEILSKLLRYWHWDSGRNNSHSTGIPALSRKNAGGRLKTRYIW